MVDITSMPAIILISILLVVISILFYVLPAYAFGDNLCITDNCNGVLGYYAGQPTVLGGTWGRTEAAYRAGDIVFVNVVKLSEVWKPVGGTGYDSLNPYAKLAAKVVGYGEKPYKPSVYLNSASCDAAMSMGYGDSDIPILYP